MIIPITKEITLNNADCIICGKIKHIFGGYPKVIAGQQAAYFGLKGGYKALYSLCNDHYEVCVQGLTESGFPDTQLLIEALQNAIDTFDWKPIEARVKAAKKALKDHLAFAEQMFEAGRVQAGINSLCAALDVVAAEPEDIATRSEADAIRIQAAGAIVAKVREIEGRAPDIEIHNLRRAQQLVDDCKAREERDSEQGRIIQLLKAEIALMQKDYQAAGQVEKILDHLVGDYAVRAIDVLLEVAARFGNRVKMAELEKRRFKIAETMGA